VRTIQTQTQKFRARRVRALARARKAVDGGVDALLLAAPPSLHYFAGCPEGGVALLIGRGRSVIYTNKMFLDRVRRDAAGCEVRTPRDGVWKDLRQLLDRRQIRRLGFEDEQVSTRLYRTWKDTLEKVELCGIGKAAALCRSIKDAHEIATIRKAVRIAESAFATLAARGARWFVGRTEKEIAGELICAMIKAGADREAFPTIVASGPNSYFCHHTPTDRRVRWNEPLLFDWGAEVNGYRSDITRTLFIGPPSDRLREIYDLVLEAHDAAVAAIRPGVRFASVGRLARRIIEKGGYGQEFRHGLGHSLGIEIHEPPTFGADPAMPALRKNVIMTVEPGVYVKGLGGVRIEDDVLVTADGAERLNSLPRSLEEAILP